MLPSESSTACAQCGRPIPPGTPPGQCPACLLALASFAGEDDLTSDSLMGAAQLRRFGDYELIEEVARGGMGVVFRARQISLNREVAVKMILAGELASPETVLRFRTEAAAAAQLQHPHIVPVYEIGEVDTQHFFSMRYIPGRRNIAAWARALPEAARFEAMAVAMSEVARAVAYAHSRGVLHRDLKPSNILMDEDSEPQVTDFGLAKILDDPAAVTLTLSSAILGSPSYMAPEQAEPRGRSVGPATDIYGLGAILYEMLSGRPPFTGATALIVVRKVVEDAPKRLLDVPEDLEAICRKCLAKAPRARYASAQALAEDLERFARGQSVHAQPERALSLLWQWARRKPIPAALTLALGLTLIGGFLAVLWQWRHAEAARRQTSLVNKELQTTNATLSQTIDQLEWRRVVQLLDTGDNALGLAQLARLLRSDPTNQRAASLAISVLEQRGFATPAAPALSHGSDFVVTQARLSDDGVRIVTAGSDGTARLWDASTSKPLGSVMKHDGPVRWVEYSSDGERLATASDDKTARVWDALTGRPLTPPLIHGSEVAMLAFSGQRLATISTDGHARIWADEQQEHLLPLDGRGVAISWSPEGDKLFTASSKGVKAWSAAGQLLFEHPVGPMEGLAPSPDGKRIAAWSNRKLWLWDIATGKDCGLTLETMTGLMAVAWSPDSKRIAGGATNNWAQVWDATTGQAITPKLKHLYACSSVVFSPDGKTLISGGHDGCTRRWDIATGTTAASPLLHREAVMGMRCSVDGAHLLVVNHPWNDRATPRGGTAQLWGLLPRGRQPWRYDDPKSMTASSVSWSPDGQRWATNSVGAEVVVHQDGKAPLTFPTSKINGWARGLAFLPDGQHVVVVSTFGEFSVWSVAQQQRTIGPMQLGTVEGFQVFPKGDRAIIGHTSGEVAVRDLATGNVITTLPSHRAPINCVDVSPDGRTVATAGEDGQCMVSDTETGVLVFPAIHAEDEIVSVQFSHDGKRIVTASHDRTARQWDARSGASLGPALRTDGEVAYAQFSPNDKMVLTADRSGAARIWSTATGAPLGEPMRHNTALRHARFSPDGSRVVTEDHTGLRLWESATGEPLTLLQQQPTLIGIGFFSQGMQVLFSPDGQSVLHGTASADFIRWDFPTPPTPSPRWLPELLEAMAGLSVSESDALMPEPMNRWLEMSKQLRTIAGDDFYARWARHYCAE